MIWTLEVGNVHCAEDVKKKKKMGWKIVGEKKIEGKDYTVQKNMWKWSVKWLEKGFVQCTKFLLI